MERAARRLGAAACRSTRWNERPRFTAGERRRVGECHASHAGDCCDPACKRRVRVRELLQILIPVSPQQDAERPDVVRRESERHTVEPDEAVRENAGTDQQQEGERYFACEQPVPEPALRGFGAEPAPRSAQRLAQVAVRRVPGGERAADRGRDRGQRRRDKRHFEIEAHRCGQRDVGWRRQGDEGPDAECREAETGNRRRERDKQALHEQLTQQAKPAAAQRGPDDELRPSRDATAQQQAGYVHACREQQHAGGHHEDRIRPPGSGAPRLAGVADAQVPALRACRAVERGVQNRPQFVFDLVWRCARPFAGDGIDVAGARSQVGDRHEQMGGAREVEMEPGRCDADDRMRPVVDLHRLLQDVGASLEIALPEIVGHDRDVRGARLFVLRPESPPQRQRDLQDLEEVRGDRRDRYALGAWIAGDDA